MKQVIPVAVFHGEEQTIVGLSALAEGGLPIAEITFRTPYAADAVALCAKRFPQISVGAGSVADAEQARRAIGSGAKFIVSPGLSEEVLAVCRKENIPYLPGAVTPTEIMRALALGISTVKFFPAQMFGGLLGIHALAAPFPQVKFVPTGGVDEANLKEYLLSKHVAAVGGSFMMKGDIAANCRRIRAILEEADDGMA